MSLKGKISILEPKAKVISGKGISFFVKVVDKYVPDRLLLFYINVLDKYVPTWVISSIINVIDEYVPNKVRSSLITAADEYVPDTVANSRKICAVLAGIGKYVPDRIVPPESVERWENIKVKFHIPRLLSSGRK